MSISMHAASAPIFARTLNNMLTWLEAAARHAEAKKFDPSVYLGLRLAPDMLPFTRQIQICSDAAKACVGRLAGQDLPRWDDNEASLDELAERIRKTIAYVNSIPAAEVDGSEERTITVPRRQGDPLKFRGEDYLRFYALPNFFFHATTMYALLRHAGVELGKADFLGRN
ncbi:DUF1993 domain-containing protein [Pelomonas sp. SE-A7]|uniref:DUF1993 domain-containing protein n=1 Tax=Pelomonas sp. SE-A7 TaxID=3054953 RepID=UPI00259CC573|nr:DUF1993 domain-containing protein [Pelomonas sp. SE-A7]MDM4764957.1 DUF1993 domain-containing protein [Pelomonas sp. SE-A7]